jgi:outer membrane lipoprotein SlyB
MSCADSTAYDVSVASRASLIALLFFSAILLHSVSAEAADISDIVVLPAAGQSTEQSRRDRYECHNWALQQNVPLPASESENAELAAQRRAEHVDKVVTGAAIGATVGSIIAGAHDYRDAGEGALAGGVAGAIGGAVAGARKNKKDQQLSNEVFEEYFRALDACMTARGYALSVAENKT